MENITNELNMKSGMVVVAHADDAEYGCSGTVAKLVNSGCDMVYVLCTDGSKGSEDETLSESDVAKIRKAEQTEAGKVLGLKDIAFLAYPDSYLTPTLELRKDIARQIRIHKPEILICQFPMRNLDGSWGFGHPDHIAAGEAAMAAVFPTARDHKTFPELYNDENLEPHKVEEVWIMGHPEPDITIDISETIDQSIDALYCHLSQMGGRSKEEVKERVGEWRKTRGREQGMQYADTFKRISLRR